MWELARSGRTTEAWALQSTGVALTELFTSEGRTLYPSTKAAMDHLGFDGGGPMRPPLRDLSADARKGLIAGLNELLPAHAKVA